MKRFIALLLMAAFSAASLTGCYGKFGLTHTIYKANGSVDNKFLRSGLTWVFVILPVYEFAFFLDFLVFNTIEFWSGSNPVASSEKTLHYASGSDSWDVRVTADGDKVTYDIRHTSGDAAADRLIVVWNRVTGESVGTHTKDGESTRYLASRSGNDIIVRNPDGVQVYKG